MQFRLPLTPATLIKRYKRFLADVKLPSGEIITATCPNTGTMLGCAEPGTTIYISKSDSPTRKYAHTWHICHREDVGFIGIDTSVPNRVVEEAITAQCIPALSGYSTLRREVKYGKNSRIDLLLEHPEKPPYYVEVKNVTLLRKPGLAEFPDCVTERGTKHLHELAEAVRQGHRAVMVYLIQNETPKSFTLTPDIDPTYFSAFKLAHKAGVEAIALTCHVSPQAVTFKSQVPLIDP
jgi:sugar fermentation stimulation protein A